MSTALGLLPVIWNIFLIKDISHDILPVLSAFSFLRHFHSHSYLNLRLFGKLYSRW